MPRDPSSPSDLRFPDWQSAYQAVLAETDTHKLFKLVEIAQSAVLTRRVALEGSADHHAERRAIEAALANLRVLKRDRLNFDH